MITTTRFDAAVKKLYEAFHNNSLNPDDCKHCAVGNILNNNDSWKHLTDKHGSTQLSYLGKLHFNLGRRFKGYNPEELLIIERSFLEGCGYTGFKKGTRLLRPENIRDKDLLFKGLSNVVSTLCRLDKIEDVMDCSLLFDFRTEQQELEIQH
ncbi:Na(+)-translocating NADH-quinone reductase subunit F [Winogradskyella alexanderae]|uniref:Na(+)-translocating NADH-quinone reductase subunit F n=1 Tax=Winogradskyella alexanderae TaxID=2877123 RepID=A0ABS7XUB4_9FLAO|nr:Na(+)-translocating NADH-quinone reductase subunit F [Winogradskyella alexanderae]MCA0132401.1 Na(+)-translocating NADH-quinone reductase subunit F [Winogradskyella alexanderae]